MKTKEDLIRLFEEDLDNLRGDFLTVDVQNNLSGKLDIFDKLSMAYSLLLHIQEIATKEVSKDV